MVTCSKCGKFLPQAASPHECLGSSPEPKNREYLGDGVYARSDGSLICLTAEDGLRVSDTVYLEREVLMALIQYGKRVGMLREGDLG